jgi:glycosyltransferase involved in cell wall biosynthesis
MRGRLAEPVDEASLPAQLGSSRVIIMNVSQPPISVIIPTYNAARFLRQTLASVFAQDHVPCEVILVDDGSTDDTETAIQPHFDQLRYFRLDNSGNASRPRNFGLAHARGELVAFLDADDVMLPGSLSGAVEIFQHLPEVCFVFTDYEIVDEAGDLLEQSWVARYTDFRAKLEPTDLPDVSVMPGTVFQGELLKHNMIGISSVVVRKDALDAAGHFDESLPSGQDLDMWLRLARSGCVFAFRDRVQFSYRRHAGSRTSTGWRRFPSQIEMFEKQRPFLQSAAESRVVDARIQALRLGYAWRLRREKEYAAAAAAFREALAERWSWYGVKGLLLTYLLRLLRPEWLDKGEK